MTDPAAGSHAPADLSALIDELEAGDDCSFCGGEGTTECVDPIQCLDPSCNGEWCTCRACNGRGHSQEVW